MPTPTLAGKNVYFTELGCRRHTTEPWDLYRKHVQMSYENAMRLNKDADSRILLEHMREILLDPVQYALYVQVHCTDNFYDVLQVPVNAEKQDIKRAYNKLALKTHDDRWVSASPVVKHQATMNFQRVNEANRVLTTSRLDYDKHKSYTATGDGTSSSEDDFYEKRYAGDFDDSRWAASGSEAEEDPGPRKRAKQRKPTQTGPSRRKPSKPTKPPKPTHRKPRTAPPRSPPPAEPDTNIQEIRLLFTLAELYSGKAVRTVDLTCGFRLLCGTWVNQECTYSLEVPKRTAPGLFYVAKKRGRYNHLLEECADLQFVAELIPGSEFPCQLRDLHVLVPFTVPLALALGGGVGTVDLTLPDRTVHQMPIKAAVHDGQEITFSQLPGLQRAFTSASDPLNFGYIIGCVRVVYPLLRPLEQAAFFTFITALTDPVPQVREAMVARIIPAHPDSV